MIEVAIITLIWTALSIWWFITHLGDKYRKDSWIDWILSPPMLILACVIGAITCVIGAITYVIRKE